MAGVFDLIDPAQLGAASQGGEAPGEFSKGMRSGGLGAMSSLHNIAGAVGGAMGADEFAQRRYTDADRYAADAAASAPRVASIRDVGSFGDFADYAAGLAGGAVPTVAALGGAGLLTGGAALPTFLAGTALTAPLEAGDIVARQRAEGAPVSLRDAGLGGIASAAVQSAVPSAAMARLRGGARIPGGSLGIPVEQAALSGAGEAVKQKAVSLEAPVDTGALVDAAAAGGVMGVPFAGVHALGNQGAAIGAGLDKAKGLVADTAKDLKGKAQGALGHVQEATQGAIGGAEDALGQAAGAVGSSDALQAAKGKLEGYDVPAKLGEVWDTAKHQGRAVLDRIANSEDVIGDAQKFAGATGEKLRALVQGDDGERLAKATEYAKNLAQQALSPEHADALKAAMTNLGDTANQAKVAGIQKAREGFTAAKGAVDSLASLVQSKLPKADGKADGKAKKTEDTTGIRDAILKEVVPVLRKARPELFDGGNPREVEATLHSLGETLRHAVKQAADGKPFDSDTIARLIDIGGKQAGDMLDAVHRAVGETDPKRVSALFGEVNRMVDIAESQDGVMQTMRDSLKDSSFEKTVTTQDLRDTMKLLNNWADMKQGATDPQAQFKDRRVREHLTELFGKNVDKVIGAVEKSRKAEQNALDRARPVVDDDGNVLGTKGDEGLTETELGGVKVQLHTAKGGLMFLHPDHSESKAGYKPAAAQRMERLKADGSLAEPRMLSVSELGEDHPLVKKTYAELKRRGDLAGIDGEEYARSEIEKYVAVSTEHPDNPQQITGDELRGMTLDRHKHADSRSRVETNVKRGADTIVLDAVKVVRAMQARFKDEYSTSDEAGRVARMGRMFAEGIAAVQDNLGQTFEIPDSTVLGKLGGKEITWADVRKLDRRTDADKESDKATNALVGLRKALREADASERKSIIKAGKKIADEQEFKKNVELTAGDGRRQLDDALGFEGDVERGINVDKRGLRESISATLAKIDEVGRQLDGEVLFGNGPQEVQLRKQLARLNTELDSLRGRLDKMTPGESLGSGQREVDPFGQIHQAAAFKDGGDPAPINTGITGESRGNEGGAVKSTGSAPSPKVVAAKKAAFIEKVRSGDAELLKTLASSTDAKGLQRAALALAREKLTPEVQRAADVINERLGALVKDNPDVAYGLQTKRYSLEAADPANSSTSSARADVQAHLEKVLGPKIKVAWAKMPHAGEFERLPTEDVIRLSVHSLNPMSTAYHESLHGFFAKLSDLKQGKVMEVLNRAAESAPVLNQLKRIMTERGYGEKALAQLNDREERAAYMYQFWADGALKVGDQSKTMLGHIADFVRSVLGVWSNDQRALHIMEYFHEGRFAGDLKLRDADEAVQRSVMAPGRNAALETARKMGSSLTEMSESLFVAGGQRLRDTGIPALRELADAMKLHNTLEGEDAGFVPASRGERARIMNRFAVAVKGATPEALSAALQALQSKSDAVIKALPNNKDRADAYTAKIVVRDTLDKTYQYMKDAGVKVNDLGVGKDYFPRVYDTSYIASHQKEFAAVLGAHGVKDPEATMKRIMVSEGAEFTVETDKPGMQFLKPRDLAFVPDAELAPFMRRDMLHIMSSYVTQATRRAEWARRFGDKGEKLTDMLAEASRQGATPADLTSAQKFIRSVDGTLGDTINPEARRLFGNMIVYQNIRLLPLAIFSSVVDPLGVMVRGGSMRDSFDTFTRGVREISKNFKRTATDDDATRYAALIGTIDDAALTHTVGALYSQGMVGDTGRKINDAFFRFNLMEQFNTSMRVGATEAALGFLARHADGKASPHSLRWLNELGLKPGDVKVGANGRVLTLESEGLSLDDAVKMKAAVNRWVDGAVLRPDAVDKPIWMSDPHFALFAHLKQFTYSFHETILKRVAHEYQNGNYAPAMALASYVPVMIAADMAKGMIQGGGSQPEWKRDWGVAEYVQSGVERAGLLGTGQFAVDVLRDAQRGGSGVGALVGPTMEQLTDAVRVLGGREQFGDFAVKSMPANALYAGVLKREATDAPFSE